jgi:hypothetical protein
LRRHAKMCLIYQLILWGNPCGLFIDHGRAGIIRT